MADRKAGREWNERKRIALAVSTIRESRGMTKEDLAKKAGYEGTGMITSIESATKNPEYGKVKDLANALDVSIAQIKLNSRIKVNDDGWADFSEGEKIGLHLFGPILDVLDLCEIKDIADYALLRCRDRKPAWHQTETQAKKRSSRYVKLEDILPEFRPLYDEYMYREIGANEFAERLGVDRKTLDRLLREFTEKSGR